MAEVGWAISALGWIVSPITTTLLNHGFALLGFDESEKLRDLEERASPPAAGAIAATGRQGPSRTAASSGAVAGRLKSAFYDAEDILDVADYHRLEKQVRSLSDFSAYTSLCADTDVQGN